MNLHVQFMDYKNPQQTSDSTIRTSSFSPQYFHQTTDISVVW